MNGFWSRKALASLLETLSGKQYAPLKTKAPDRSGAFAFRFRVGLAQAATCMGESGVDLATLGQEVVAGFGGGV